MQNQLLTPWLMISKDGVYEDSWNVTDSYESDTPLRLVEGVDYIKAENQEAYYGKFCAVHL